MSKIGAISPLAHRPLAEKGLVVSLQEQTGLGVMDLRIAPNDAAAQAQAAAALGVPLPIDPRTSAASRSIQVLWMSIDQWWIVGPRGDVDQAGEKLNAALAGHHAAVTDVGAMRAVIRITGDAARAVLSKCVPIDCFSAEIVPGFVRRVTFGEIAAALHMVEAGPDRFDLYVFRSYADYTATWLEEAARESAAIAPFAPGAAAPV